MIGGAMRSSGQDGGVAGAAGLVAVLLVVSGCSYPNQLRNVPEGSMAARPKGSINEQPTSFWRCGERFRIPPGPTLVRAIYGEWDLSP